MHKPNSTQVQSKSHGKHQVCPELNQHKPVSPLIKLLCITLQWDHRWGNYFLLFENV